MTLPGPVIITGTQRAARVFPTSTDTLFLVGESERGKVGQPVELRSAQDLTRKLGSRLAANPLAWDSLELFFAEGGSRAVFSRYAGPNPVRASFTFVDGSAANTMRVHAKSEGGWGNSLNAQVTAGTAVGSFRIVVTHDTDTAITETSPDLADVTEAVAWATTTATYVDVEDLTASSLDPATGTAQSLTGGTDDRNNISQTEITAALTAIPKSMGAGQVAAPGLTTDAAHAAVIAHAAATNRVPRLDGVDTGTVATITAKADTDRGVTGHKSARFSANWVTIKGVVPGSVRYVPGSAALAAFEARNDIAGVSPNQPAAGYQFGAFESDLVLGFAQDGWTNTEREQLADKGCTAFVTLDDGTLCAYDSVTLANQVLTPDDARAGLHRLMMRVRAEVDPVAQRYQFREITAANLFDLQGDIAALLQKYQPGSIDTFNVAARPLPECRAAREFRVDADLQVNPDGRVVRLTFTAEGAE